MAIRLMEDVGAPLVVTAVDLITETTAPTWNEYISYVAAIGGYVGSAMGWGGPFLKNVGIASFPWAAKSIYNRVRGISGRSQRLGLRTAGSSSGIKAYQPITPKPELY